MTRTEFERLVAKALNDIPQELSSVIDNVDIIVEDLPSREQLVGSGLEDGYELLGLYEGLPLTERADYSMVLPDRITIFQKSIEAICSNNDEIVKEVRDTVVHEVAHHFGIDDERLHELGV
jgi:predicted Zn-dependent protease with MMP-like domain